MDVFGIFISPFVQVMVDKLSSYLINSVSTADAGTGIKNLKKALEDLETLLADAQNKQVYDADDLLDDFATEALEKKLMEEETKMEAALMSTTSISTNMNNVPMLNGTNFKDWKENILIVLGCMDIDLALRMPKPNDLTEQSTPEEIVYFEKWDRSNRLSLMIMKRGIPEVFRGAITEDVTVAGEFLSKIQKRFTNDKAETSTLLASLISMKYKGKGNVCEYIMEMSHLASKLKALKLDLSDDLLVHLVLISLPAQFNQFKVSYNCQKEKWTLNELISFCVQEEERLKQERTESAHLASTSKHTGKRKHEGKEVAAPKGLELKKQKVQDGCFFCGKPGHRKKDCAKYVVWRVKKGLLELPKTN